MSDEHHDGNHEDPVDERPSRPPPRNPFAEPDPDTLDDDLPALIEGRKSAAVAGVIVGLIALVLVVGLCATAAYAFR